MKRRPKMYNEREYELDNMYQEDDRQVELTNDDDWY